MGKLSVKLRVTLWYTFSITVISCILLFAMSSFADNMMKTDIEITVTRIVRDMSKEIVDRNGNLRAVPDFMFFKNGVHLILYDENKNIIGGMNPFSTENDLSIINENFRQSVYDGNKYYEYDRVINTKSGEYYLKGIMPISEQIYGVKAIIKNNVIILTIVILFTAFGGYLIVGRALSPVDKISKTAEKISDGSDLSQRINIGENIGHDEIYNLANTFDKMLDKIENTLNREKQFTSDASHELRTPVAVILSECEYMEECANNIDDYKESAESIKRQASRMSKLISDLLTISRMDKDTLQKNFEIFDISELLNFVCDDMEEINGGGVKLSRDIQPSIMAAADRFLITRVFINLISNAYRYIGDGSRIDVTLREENENVLFSVKDDGIGIAEEHLSKIWERFYQVDTARTAEENGSMGLGLSMVKWIVECHNGNITVKSTLGEGSEFILTFPKKHIDAEISQ